MSFVSWFKQYDLQTEIWGGIANFMACVYVVIINPMLMYANGAGFPIAPSVTSTVVTVIVLTLISGFFLKLPFIMAPGMGFNIVITYNLVMQQHLPIPIALGIMFWSSIMLLIATLTNIHKVIITTLPPFLQQAISIGLGCFLIMIGLQNAHIIVIALICCSWFFIKI
jgi:AGZA family xanthine/uracil permease-like MFS transporter